MQDQRDPTQPDDLAPRPSPQRAFALRMRRLRDERGMSQTALAKALESYGIKLDGTAITRIEKNSAGSRGKDARIISLNEAVAISEVLNTSIENMLRPTPSLNKQITLAMNELDQAETTRRIAEYESTKARKRLDILQMRLDAQHRQSTLLSAFAEASEQGKQLAEKREQLVRELANENKRTSEQGIKQPSSETTRLERAIADINAEGMEVATRMANIGHHMKRFEYTEETD
jgi:transcriptional regulator with XRE-family HTH domain